MSVPGLLPIPREDERKVRSARRRLWHWRNVVPAVRIAAAGTTLCVLFLLASSATWRERIGHALVHSSNGLLAGILSRPVEHINIVSADADLLQATRRQTDRLVGGNIIETSPRSIYETINRLPYIDNARVEKRYPATVVVHFDERRPVAIWEIDGHFVLVDAGGDVIGDQSALKHDVQDFKGLPLLVGAGAPEAFKSLSTAMQQSRILATVTVAARISRRRWDLTLANGCVVRLPEGGEDTMVRRLALLEQTDHVLERPVTEIDMRLPDRIIMRQARHDAETVPAAEATPPPKELPPR